MDMSGHLLSQLRSGRRRAGPTSRAEHPDGSLPRHHTVKDVPGYREAAGCEFARGVAHGAHRLRRRHRHTDASRPDMTCSQQPTILAHWPKKPAHCRGAPHGIAYSTMNSAVPKRQPETHVEIEMDDRTVRAALERHWAASDAS